MNKCPHYYYDPEHGRTNCERSDDHPGVHYGFYIKQDRFEWTTDDRRDHDGVPDAEIKCGYPYTGHFGYQECDLPDGHQLHSWERATPVEQCLVTLMIDHGQRRVVCRLPHGHDGEHTENP